MAAGISQTWEGTGTKRKASMRPRPNGRGNPARARPVGARAPASMRPRPNGRGNHHPARFSPCWKLASMRPRPNGRGNRGAGLHIRQGYTGFNEAAAEWPREFPRQGFLRAQYISFNEAAAEWPRE